MARSNHDTETNSDTVTAGTTTTGTVTPESQPLPLESGSSLSSPESPQGIEASTTALAAQKPQKFGVFKGLLWAIALLLTGGTSAILGAALMIFAPASFAPQSAETTPDNPDEKSIQSIIQGALGYQVTRPVNILVMGIDRVPDADPDSPEIFNGRSDTLLLVRVDPIAETVNVLSIPRDTQVRVPGLGITKVNHANAYGGAELAAITLTNNFEGVTIDRYIRVDTDAFKEIIDLIGGVEIFVPTRMEYTDNSQGLFIDLQPGLQVLDGDQAEQFARFRRDATGDIGRVQRQQLLLRALREQIARPATIPKIPQAIELLQSHIDTNMSLEEMLALINVGLQLNRDKLQMVLLPGRFSTPEESIVSYWILDPASRTRLMHDFFGVPLSDVFVEVTDVNINRLRIAVQNGTDTPELSRDVARYLRDQGFRNVYVIQDSTEPLQETQIISQRGDLASAQAVQTRLHVGQVVPSSTGDLGSDLTLRLGQDWEFYGQN